MESKNEFARNRAVLIHGSGERKNHKYIARRTEKFEYNSDGSLSGKKVTNSTDKDGSWDSTTTLYDYKKTRSFIENLLDVKGVWNKGTSYNSRGSFTRLG